MDNENKFWLCIVMGVLLLIAVIAVCITVGVSHTSDNERINRQACADSGGSYVKPSGTCIH